MVGIGDGALGIGELGRGRQGDKEKNKKLRWY